MQFGKIHGVALAVLGVILLAIQVMLYMTPQRVVSDSAQSSIPKAVHKSNPLAGILGIASLVAGVAIFSTRRRPDEPEARHAIQQRPASSASGPASSAPSKKVPEVRLQESPTWPAYLVRGVGSVWGALIIVGVVPFLTFFMLCSKDQTAIRMNALFNSRVDTVRFITNLDRMIRGFVAGNLIIGSAMDLATTLVLLGIGMKGAVTIGIASGLLNLLLFLGLIFSLAIPLAAAILQFNTPGPYILISLTILFLHQLSANFLIRKFIATRVSIGPVVATIGILFWGWLWAVMGLLLAVPLTALVKLVADLHPSLCHVSNALALTPRPIPRWLRYGETAMGRAIPYLRGRPGTKSAERP